MLFQRFISPLLLALLTFVSFAVFAATLIENFEQKFVKAAIERSQHEVHYDGSYFAIPYPNGDVASDIGVCTDVIIRSFRALNIDLQQLVHEDMAANFAAQLAITVMRPTK